MGPSTVKKLENVSVYTILDLAAVDVNDLVEAGFSRETAESLSLEARVFLESKGLINNSFISAEELLEKRKKMRKMTTFSKNLDGLLGGGIETQAVTEFYGSYGSGKTQICHCLSVSVQLPEDKRGLNGSAIYIDCENTFRPERVKEIAENRELDSSQILKNIYVVRAYNSSHLELIVKSLGDYVKKFKAKLVIVDSIISHYRAEYLGRGNLAERQQRLNSILHKLLRIAEIYNIAVVITNQVQAKPDVFFGDPTNPSGGHVLAHASTYRIYLKKAGDKRIARMVDSPCHPMNEVKFRITEKGIEDAN